MNKKQLKEAFEKKLITEDKYKEELFKLETQPKKKRRHSEPNVIDYNEFGRILKHTYKEHHKLGFKLAYLCGLRLSEVIGLQPEDVDYKRGLIKVIRGKGAKDRFVKYPKGMAGQLKKLPLQIDKRSLQKAFAGAVKRAGIKKRVRFHDLRHSFSTNLDKKGMSTKSIQVLMGHSNIATTSRYLHKDIDEVSKEWEEIVDG